MDKSRERQFAREADDVTLGAQAYYERTLKNAKDGSFGYTPEGLVLIEKYIVPLAGRLVAFMDSALEGSAGLYNAGALAVECCNPVPLCGAVLRTVFSEFFRAGGLAKTDIVHHPETFLARAIRDTIRQEANEAIVERYEPYVYLRAHEKIRKARLQRKKAVEAKLRIMLRKRAAFIAKGKHLATDSKSLNHAAAFFLNSLLDLKICSRATANGWNGYGYTLTQEVIDLVGYQRTFMASLNPLVRPMVCPPANWGTDGKGGYLGKAQKYHLLVSGERQNAALIQACAAGVTTLALPLEALNHVQAVAWRVNSRVLDTLKKLRLLGVDVPGVPSTEKPENEEYVQYTENDEDVREVSRNMERVSKRILIRKTEYDVSSSILRRAEVDVDEEAIYFPWHFDYRGRMYPIAPGLSPQGSDLAKGLLQFADSYEIVRGSAAGTIFEEYGVELYGDTFDFAVAKDEWSKAKKPVQFLAWSFEMAVLADTGRVQSHLPIQMDGSCNGIQHYAALTRDASLARRVNVLPQDGDKKGDVYLDACESLREFLGGTKHTGDQLFGDWQKIREELREEFEKRSKDLNRLRTSKEEVLRQFDLAIDGRCEDGANVEALEKDVEKIEEEIKGVEKEFAEYRESRLEECKWVASILLLKVLDRDMMKPFVMTMPYGSTTAGRNKTFRDTLEDRWVNGELPEDMTKYDASFIARYAFPALERIVTSLLGTALEAQSKIQHWQYQHMVDTDSPNGTWMSPSGFPVITSSDRTKRDGGIEVKVRKSGAIHLVCSKKNIEKPETPTKGYRRIKSSIAPNFIHSLDAAHMHRVLKRCKEEGITSVQCIHDCYGVHAVHAETLARIIRDEFAALHKLTASEYPWLQTSDFDVDEVKHSKFFFC